MLSHQPFFESRSLLDVRSVAVVDDDDQAAAAMGELILDAGFQPVIVAPEFRDLDRLIQSVEKHAEAAVCDHRLRHRSFAGFDGAEAAAGLFEREIPAILVTQYFDTDADVSIRLWRQWVPVLLTRDDASDPDRIREGLHVTLEEIHGQFQQSRKPWRSLVEIDSVTTDSGMEVVDARIPQWNPDEVVRFPLKLIPEEMRGSLEPGSLLIANCNIGAASQEDLYFSDFALAPPPVAEDDLG
jgi:CheY-like chemotaxis protein